MKEIRFVNLNANRWEQFEQLLNIPGKADPDTMAELYIQLTDDLAYAKTYYPNSNTTKYLNQITGKAHQVIYSNKKEKKNRIVTFWTYELPIEVKKQHRKLLYSFVIFFVSVLIGMVSTAHDDTFVRLILGESYVNMTLSNIEKGDPMAVYKQANEMNMFLGITINNIRVSFFAFVLGLFISVGTGIILFYNGVMLGAFSYFFYQHDLLAESIFTVWIHGTLEIAAIIIAGGAGLVLGNSILFPGTYKRKTSFLKGVKSGVKIVVGLMPIFIVAGFLEGFITRHTEFPYSARGTIILTSLAFIIWYFIIYPNKIQNKYSAYEQPGKLH